MAVYRCRACGYVFDEEKEERSIRDIDVCPRCGQPDDRFVLVEESEEAEEETEQKRSPAEEYGKKMAGMAEASKQKKEAGQNRYQKQQDLKQGG